jgi:hypothetical protein
LHLVDARLSGASDPSAFHVASHRTIIGVTLLETVGAAQVAPYFATFSPNSVQSL